MSNNDNKWGQPEAPPPPLFTGQKERDIVKQVTDEVIERVIGTSILYYPISIKHSDFHPLYGEAINKTYLPPVHVEVLAEWEGEDTTTTGFGIDKQSAVTIHFHKRRLTEDQNLFVREGDFIQYGEQKYEIVSLSQPTLLFGQVDYKVEVSAKCVRARDGTFPSESYPDPEEDDPRFTAAPACDPIEEIRVLTGDTTSTGGSGEQPCGEVYERPGTPPPPLFTGKKESNLVKQVNDELLERVVGQQVVYFPISVPHSDFHELYGEAINKTFLPPIRVFAAVSWEGSETTTTNYGIDRKSSIQVRFHKRRLSEDQNLFVREGDFVLYGKILYEIVKVGQPKLLFGKIDEKFEVVADCIRAREGTFRLSEVEGVVNEFDLDSVTACDNANLVIPDGVDNTMANVGSGAGVFKNKTGIQFNMKTLVAGENIVLTATDNEITIDSAGEISGTITNALTASYVETAQTASWVSGSNVYGPVDSAYTASYVEVAQTASYVAAANIDGTVLSASFAHTASYVETAQTASYVDAANIDGTVLSASFAHTASYVETAQTASFFAETDTLASVVARGSATTGSITVAEVTASGFSAAGHYIPTDDAVYDIGTADKQIRDIYVSAGSIIFGGEHRIEINTDTNTFNFDSPESRGLSIPCVETISSNDYADGTMVYDKTNHKFMFRQDSEWVELGTNTDGNSGGNTGDGTTNVTVAGIGSGILTLTDDLNGPNRLLLEEYTTNAIAYSGKTLYLANVADNPIGPFVLGAKFYFNEGGVWHPSHFFSSAAQEQAVPAVFPDMQDILSLDATRAEDLAILNGLYQNSASYGGRAIYLSSTGSSPVGPFVQEQKYYFNEGGTWHASSFYSTNEEYEE